MEPPKTFYLRTYGCQMNELDSEIVAGMLEQRGYCRSDDEKSADIIIFNTCSVRDLAERKVLGKMGQLMISRRDRPFFGLMGCMATTKKETLFEKLPELDFVVGPNNIHEIAEVIEQVIQNKGAIAKMEEQFSTNPDYSLASRNDHLKAYVSIIRGCNKFCSYCIVPYARGREVSRHPNDIVQECRLLVDKGYKEVVLLGQNVNSYGKDHPDWGCLFPELLERLDDIEGLLRIRFMTSHPVDITVALMEAIRDFPSVCEFVHFPLQSGSDRILTMMNRKYSVTEYREKVHMLRNIVPNVALGTDIIVGFPTESEDEFLATMTMMEEIRYSTTFLFMYSPRKGTVASKHDDDIPKEEKKLRHHRLMALQDGIYQERYKRFVNTTVEVLVESQSERDPSLLKGRTRQWDAVIFPGNDKSIGTLQKVAIESHSHQTLIGTSIRD